MVYSPEVRRRFLGPNCFGNWESKQKVEACGSAQDSTQGVWVRFDAQVAGGCVAAVRHQVFGCPHTIAAASLAAEHWVGSPVTEAPAFQPRRSAETLDVPAEKLGRLLIVEDAVNACWQQLVKRETKE